MAGTTTAGSALDLVLPAPPVPTVAVASTKAHFPVRRVLCVGRNYAAHVREMGRDPDREPPFFFFKPADAVVDDSATIPYAPETSNLHYEIELVVALGKPASTFLSSTRSTMSMATWSALT
jgi:fumarylpyruvate hydrolase